MGRAERCSFAAGTVSDFDVQAMAGDGDKADPERVPHADEPSTEELRQQWHMDFEKAVHAATGLLHTAYTSLELKLGTHRAEQLAPVLLESLVKGAMAEANDLQDARLQQRMQVLMARAIEQQQSEFQRQNIHKVPTHQPW